MSSDDIGQTSLSQPNPSLEEEDGAVASKLPSPPHGVHVPRQDGTAVVVVEGDLWGELRFRKISPNAVLGAQLALYAMGVGLIYTEDKAHTGALVCLAAKRSEKQGVKTPTVKKRADIKTMQVALLASLPGIGPKRAEQLLKKYGTPLNALLNYKSWELDEKRHALIKKILETPHGEGGTLDDFF